MPNILIIDASRAIRNSLRERLEYEKYKVETAESAPKAFEVIQTFDPDVVLCDRYDIETLNCPFIVLSDNSSIDHAAAVARAGACELIPKPIDMNLLLAAIRKAVDPGADEPEPETESDAEQHHIPEAKPFISRKSFRQPGNDPHCMVGNSHGIMHVKDLVERVAPSEARVLITGNNGTGKELVARMLHAGSRRAAAPFVEINCAAIPSELIESELFGHEKGSFTSAIKQRKGKFEQAAGGTLFMDEVGDMSLSAQAKVLRALQERRICRVGSDKDIAVDVRVLAATNKDMREEIARGAFREDLYHRLSVIIIHVPPLIERTDDIPLLIDHFIEDICREYAVSRKKFSPESIDELCRMPWHGNVRELRNVVERLIILGGKPVSVQDVQVYVSDFVI